MILRALCILSLVATLPGCDPSQTNSRSESEPAQSTIAGPMTPAASNSNQAVSVTLKIGMLRKDVSEALLRIGASDISADMQATTRAQKADWMWTLGSPKMSLATLFENEKLITINVWDWRGRQMTSYHHTMQYDQVDSLTIHSDGTFECNVLRTHNSPEKYTPDNGAVCPKRRDAVWIAHCRLGNRPVTAIVPSRYLPPSSSLPTVTHSTWFLAQDAAIQMDNAAGTITETF